MFSSTPWNEPWQLQTALLRISHFYHSAGFAGLLIQEGETTLGFVLGNTEPFYRGPICYLREFCIANERQGQGLGRQLLAAFESHLLTLGIDRVYLMTEREIPASRFYKHNGFSLDESMGFFAKRLEGE